MLLDFDLIYLIKRVCNRKEINGFVKIIIYTKSTD